MTDPFVISQSDQPAQDVEVEKPRRVLSQEQRDRKAARMKEYAQRPDVKNAAKVAAKKYRESHPDRLAQMRAKRADQQLEYARGWRKGNAEYLAKHAARQKERRAKKKAAGTFTALQAKLAIAFWNRRCAYCGAVTATNHHPSTGFDHVIPLIDGGRNDPSNIVVCCKLCNDLKNRKHPAGDEFAQLIAQLAMFASLLPPEASWSARSAVPLEVRAAVAVAEEAIRGRGVPVGKVW